MESGKGQSSDQFQPLAQQEDEILREEGEQSYGGKRSGVARKWLHESGYKHVKFIL